MLTTAPQPTALPHGVRLLRLADHADERGVLTELFRRDWIGVPPVVQWNAVRSAAGVMRGVHIHLGYDEYYVLLEGSVTIGMRDLRRGSPSEGRTALVELPAHGRAMASPGGIAHGLLCRRPALLLVGTTTTWEPANELGCHWLDPDLAIPWPVREARLSESDRALPRLADVASRVPPWR